MGHAISADALALPCLPLVVGQWTAPDDEGEVALRWHLRCPAYLVGPCTAPDDKGEAGCHLLCTGHVVDMAWYVGMRYRDAKQNRCSRAMLRAPCGAWAVPGEL